MLSDSEDWKDRVIRRLDEHAKKLDAIDEKTRETDRIIRLLRDDPDIKMKFQEYREKKDSPMLMNFARETMEIMNAMITAPPRAAVKLSCPECVRFEYLIQKLKDYGGEERALSEAEREFGAHRRADHSFVE